LHSRTEDSGTPVTEFKHVGIEQWKNECYLHLKKCLGKLSVKLKCEKQLNSGCIKACTTLIFLWGTRESIGKIVMALVLRFKFTDLIHT